MLSSKPSDVVVVVALECDSPMADDLALDSSCSVDSPFGRRMSGSRGASGSGVDNNAELPSLIRSHEDCEVDVDPKTDRKKTDTSRCGELGGCWFGT